jgi:peptidyl-prolyl cis-trans isomerase D
MIMDFSRRYRKWIFWGLIILVGVPFIFITTDYVPFADQWGLGGPQTTVVAAVGDREVLAEELMAELSMHAQPMQPGQPPRSLADLEATGEARQVLQNLIDAKLIEQESQAIDLAFNRDYLDEALKKDPYFQNEQGQFDPEAWNEWVELQKANKANWEAVRQDVANGVRRQLLQERITASARVREEELKDEFEKQHTRVRLRYLTVQPKVEPTEEQIQQHYEANKTQYELPAKRTAEFVAFSVEAPRPAVLDELAQRARNGEAFTELAKTTVENVTLSPRPDTGWIAQDKAQTGQDILFTTPVGQVTDPVQTRFGYSIYKVLEERTNPETGTKEVRAEELAVFPRLAPEERQAIQERADAFAQQAKTGNDLNAAAVLAGVQVQTTGEFTSESTEIENVPEADATILARMLSSVPAGQVSDVITGARNLYVAKPIEIAPAQPQPLEAVREDVIQDWKEAQRMTPEYQTRVQNLAQEIAQKAKTLDEAKAQFPDLDAEIQELEPFDAKTYGFGEGKPFWNVQEVIERAVDAGPGKMVGPLADFMGGSHFVELVEAQPPDEKAWAEEYPAEREQIRQRILAMRRMERFQDYLAYLKGNVPIRLYEDVYNELVKADAEAAGQTPATPAAASDAPASAPEAPAEEAEPGEQQRVAVPPIAPAPVAPIVPSAPMPEDERPEGAVPTSPAGGTEIAPTPEAAPDVPAEPAPAAPETPAPAE